MSTTTIPLPVLNPPHGAAPGRPLARNKAEAPDNQTSPARAGRRATPSRRIALGRVAAGEGHASDLRRRRDGDAAEVIVRRADYLPDDDRALLRAVYADGMRIAELASLRARRKEHPLSRSGAIRRESVRSLRRRVRHLVARVLSPEFILVLRRQQGWTPTRRRIGQACVLDGLTMRQAAARTGASLHSVRRHMEAIRALADAESGARAPARTNHAA